MRKNVTATVLSVIVISSAAFMGSSIESMGAVPGPVPPGTPEVSTAFSMSEPAVGVQLKISTPIYNILEEDKEYVLIIEVRNSERVTEYLAWQSGLIEAKGKREIGVSWIPENSGNYEIRVFTLSGLQEPVEILSGVNASYLTIRERSQP